LATLIDNQPTLPYPSPERIRPLSSRQTFVRQMASVSVLLSLMGHASASISEIVAFGDSLSDNGNLFNLTYQPGQGGIPADPYYGGRFSDGLLAVEAMAFQLTVPIKSYAFGGAQTGSGNQINLLLPNTGVASQIQTYVRELNSAPPPSSTLFFVWAGPNDFYAGNNMFDPATSQMASSNLLNDIQTLFDAGASQFFVPLMADLGITPAALQSDDTYRAAAHSRTVEFNAQLTDGMAQLERRQPDLHAIMFDTPAFMYENVPTLQSEGFNVTDACYDAYTRQICGNENKYVFWDSVHPTATTDWLLGKAFVAAVAVPEPGSVSLMMFGILALITAKRARHLA
jgi:phospholipase/lecithinase/hemolysin